MPPQASTTHPRTMNQSHAQTPLVQRPHSVTGMHIGFVSTRLAGTDGVSLETQKWATVLERMGCRCFYFAGVADTPAERSQVVPEAFFDHPYVRVLQQIAFSRTVRPPAITRRIRELTAYLKAHIAAFVRDYDIDMLVVENALTIPMHLSLGLALTELIAETAIPTIAHHHDFYVDRLDTLASVRWHTVCITHMCGCTE